MSLPSTAISAPSMVIKYLRLPFDFDAARLQEEVALLERDPWQPHYQKLHYEGDWSALPLRSIGGRPDDIIISPHPESRYEDTPFLKASPYLQEVLAQFRCPLGAVRLLRLSRGAVIKEHRDAGLHYEQGEIRLHIPVITHEAVAFYLDGERLRLEEGTCWYLNFNLPHAIVNNSDTDRIHLVIDAEVNDWVRQVFSQPSTPQKMTREPGLSAAEKVQVIEQLRLMNTATSMQLADELEKSPEPGQE